MPMDDETPRTTTANDGGTGGAGAVAQLLVAHTGDRRGVGEVLIDEDETELAVRVLHTSYGLDEAA